MSTKTNEQKEAAAVETGRRIGSFLSAIINSAIISWLAGIGLSKGFGVHVPFIAGLVLVLAAIQLVAAFSTWASREWHKQAIQAAPQIAAASIVGTLAAQGALAEMGHE